MMDNAAGGRIFLPLIDRCKDGRLYQVNNRARNGIIYLRCHNSIICFGTAKLENERISHGRPHSEDCLTDDTAVLIGAFKQSLKDSLAGHWYKLRDLFDQTALLYPEAAALVTFQSLRSYMVRCRRRAYPARPTDLQEFGEQLNDPANGRALEYVNGRFTTKLLTDSDGNRHIVIHDEQFIRSEIERDMSKLFIDATFSSTPNLDDAYQLMTILGIEFNHGIPFVWVVMSRKLRSSYVCVLQYIRDNVLRESRINLIMSDFEAAIRNAANTVFPGVHCTGCNTHYDRAILQKLKSLGLQPFIRENDEAAILTKKLLALAYLPADMIQRQYTVIKTELPADIRTRFTAFFTYYQRYWLRTISPEGFSVFGLSRRTNNIVESYNSKLGYHLQAHPSPWDFISKLLILQNHAKCDVERLKRRSGGITRHARYQTIYKNNQLQKAWSDLYFGRISADEFIIRATHLKGDIRQKIARESNGRDGESFEMTGQPRHIPLAADPDYDHELFREVRPGLYMLDNAIQPQNEPVDLPPMQEHPALLARLDEQHQLFDEAAFIPQDATPPGAQQGEDVFDEPVPARFPSPEWEPASHEEDSEPEIVEVPPAPEPQPEPITPDAEGPEVATNSRQARRRRRQRLRRRNVPFHTSDVGSAYNSANASGEARSVRRKRRRGNAQGSNKPKCVICMVRTPTHAFLPCGHKCCCEECSNRLYRDHLRRTCPFC